MRSAFYAELAGQNLIKNRRFYLPYILTCIGTAAMFYIMCALATNEGLESGFGASTLSAVLGLGVGVIGIFAVLILFYTNSFLMKRRQKEFGLYSVLGMEKRHIGRVLFWESCYAYLISMALGIGFGLLMSRLLMLMLVKITGLTTTLTFSISLAGVVYTLMLFLAIFCVVFLRARVKLMFSNPSELLRGGNVGEKEPKAKWVFATLGVLTLGTGYCMAITIKEPLMAIALFFVAVILVIVGTYLMFMAGSIAILKLLKKNKGYYYRADHFTSVSGMLYRMKQNAAGLASICILSTMVLVMVSTTVSLYAGIEDGLRAQYPRDVAVTMRGGSAETDAAREKVIRESTEESGAAISNWQVRHSLGFSAYKRENAYTGEADQSGLDAPVMFEVMTQDAYARLTGETIALGDREVAVSDAQGLLPDEFTLLGQPLSVVKRLENPPMRGQYAVMMAETHLLVVSGEAALDRIDAAQRAAYPDRFSTAETVVGFDVKGTDAQLDALEARLTQALSEGVLVSESEGENIYSESYIEFRRANEQDAYALYGGLLFLGLFLGLLFMMATVLIIYYKQVSEGYDDAQRFDIMRKVGMGRDEVKKSIRSQIQTVFFLPLAVAVVHVAAAFPMIARMMAVLKMDNVFLFAACSGVALGVFALVYLLVYLGTARTYYKIVAPAK
ncbi:MAG: ABC transporter permease [Clostridia bacterium]